MKRKNGITKSGGQKHNLDKFYTKPEIALQCIQLLDLNSYDVIIEPSAGNGAFSKQIPNCVAYDLDPEAEGILKQNWFDFSSKRDIEQKTLIIGNPPYGQQNSLALKFINHATSFADTIAFILPQSFRKESIQNKINLNFTLRYEWIIPENSFLLQDKSANVPSVFQVWDYAPYSPRALNLPEPYKGFSFVKKSANPDLYVQRIGWKSGSTGINWADRSESSNYFIKVDSSVISVNDFVDIVKLLPHKSRDFTVGPRSIGKRELIKEILEAKPSLKQ